MIIVSASAVLPARSMETTSSALASSRLERILSARRSALKTPAAELEAGAWLFCENALVVSVAVLVIAGLPARTTWSDLLRIATASDWKDRPVFSARETWGEILRKKSPAISPGLGS
jgi:hypothetical protein